MARLSEVSWWFDVVRVEFSFRRGLGDFSEGMARSSEATHLSEMVWCNHGYALAQARRGSLSDTDGLA
ncbi:hypothetical protein DEO72_LG3g979 [Vigna unguiculata]|uniref:Uncharacterized protein n=1 Tax=Vigna unguiculata TaxID=3917 RepID=A0A4D6LDH9_VIGUN|nr:hypothetical protein DEO72_LG3g979 [Vigna unguiculata]